MYKECKHPLHSGDRLLSVEFFHKDKQRKDGYYPYCKGCHLQSRKMYRANNPEKVKQEYKQTYSNHKDTIKRKNKLFYENNREVIRNKVKLSRKKKPEHYRTLERKYYHTNVVKARQSAQQWKERNANHVLAYTKTRNQKKKIPIWESKNNILLVYKEAEELTTRTGIKHHVHHRIPLLEDKSVCGLHCGCNLIILTENEHRWYHSKPERLQLLY